MREALRAKFEQHASLKSMLLNTDEAELIEHTSNDSYWGDAGGDGTGKNRLGQLLMELREHCGRKQALKRTLCHTPTNTPAQP